MTMQGSDFYSGSALTGAAGGAASGAMIGSQVMPGYGTAVGGLLGAGIGLFGGASANSQRAAATTAQSKNMDSIMRSMRELSQQSYDGYLAGLKKAQAFYGPATSRWNYLYGVPGQEQFPNMSGA